MADPLQLAQAAKSYTDLQNIQNLTNAQSQLLNTQGLSGKNIYATQVLSGAIPGGQGAYDAARQALQQQGVDTSAWAPDVQTASQQAIAAKLSQSPLGPLIDAQAKQQSANAATAGVNGTMAPGPTQLPGGLGALLSGAANSVVPGAGALMQPSQMSPTAGAALPPTAGQIPTQAGQSLPPMPAYNPVVDQLGALPAVQKAVGQVPNQAPAGFVPPDVSGMNPKTANEVIQRAFEQYKASPDYLAASKQAEAQGTKQADLNVQANAATNTVQQLNQNLDALQKLATQIPSSNYMSPDMKAAIYTRLPVGSDDKDAASALGQFNEVNQQQIINGLKQLVQSGQIRGNQFVEKILSQGYGINTDQPTNGILADIDSLRSEISNSAANAQNMAGTPTPYQAIPTINSAQVSPQPATVSTLPANVVSKLSQAGYSQDQINAYLKAKGM